MRTLGTLLTATAATALLLAGCGSGEESSPTASASDGYEGCTAADVADEGRVVARADLFGDGAPVDVRLVGAASTRCPDSLVVVHDGDVVGADVHGRGLTAAHARVVHLRGGGADLLLLRGRSHPRGGYALHLVGAGADGLTGLEEPFRFVAIDGGEPPSTAVCTPGGGVAVDSVQAHEPPGIVLAWDVLRTTYDVRDGVLTETGSRSLGQAVADPVLRERRPDLFDGGLFAGCSSAA